MKNSTRAALLALPFTLIALPSLAEEVASISPEAFQSVIDNSSALRVGIDTVWVLVTAMLVFWMNAGFALVESGLCRAKNTSNILAKNFIVFAASSISFWAVGWGLMFGDGNPFVGTQGLWFVSGADNSPALGEAYAAMNPFSKTVYAGVYSAINWTPVPLWAKFFFQLVFAGTAATIVSGAVAERIKFKSFLVFSFLLVAFIYPITGHWIWGGGLLGANNFRDFAGSTVVHSVGGWAALAGVLVLGARIGKYGKDGRVNPMPGHSMTSAALGCLVLWLGWFGFNPGSTMAAMNGTAIAHILVNTNMAAATGALGAMCTAWLLLGKPDLSMILNGCLAGLVAHHRSLRLREHPLRRPDRPDRRRAGGGGGDRLRSDQGRRSGRRALRAPGERHLGHARAGHLLRQPDRDRHRGARHRPLADGADDGAAQRRRLRRCASPSPPRSSSGTRSSS